MNPTDPSEELNWREIMKKYMRIVSEQEGVYFLEEYQWTAEEWAEISKLMSSQNKDSKVSEVGDDN